MAEANKLKIELEVDDSDVKRKLQRIDVKPVDIEVKKPKPVKIEASADKVRIEVDDAEAKKRIEALTSADGVKKIRVVTEDGKTAGRKDGKEIFEIQVDAKKAKKTIDELKADKRIRFVAEVEKPAEVPVKPPKPVNVPVKPKVETGGLVKSLGGVRSAATRVLQAFGVFSMGAGLVMSSVAAVGKLVDMLTEASRKAEASAVKSMVEGVSSATDKLIGKEEKVLRLMRDELETMQRQKDLRDTAKAQQRTAEDATRKLSQDERMAGVTDPEERERLQRRFEDEDRAVARRRESDDRAAKAEDLDATARKYRDKAAELPDQKNIEDQIKLLEYAKKSKQISVAHDQRAWYEMGGLLTSTGTNNRRIREAKDDPEVKAIDEKIKALKEKAKEIEEERKRLNEEADYYQQKSAIVQGGQPTYDQTKAEYEQRERIRKKAEDAAKRKEAAEYDEADRKANEATGDAMFKAEQDDQFERSFKAAERRERDARTKPEKDAAQQQQMSMLQGREAEAKERLREAEEELAYEMKKDAADRDEERMARARASMREAQSDMFGARSRREDLEDRIRAERQRKIDAHFDGLADQAFAGRPKNRLTAMGLGSGGGVSVDRTAQEQASNVRILVQLAKEQLAATKANKPKQGYATFAP